MTDRPRLAALALQALGPRHTGGAAPSTAEHMRFLSEPHSLRLLHAALAGKRVR